MNSLTTMTSKILITAGDPNGIGPEVLLKGLDKSDYFRVLILSNFNVINFWKNHYQLNIDLNSIDSIENLESHFKANCLNILNIPYKPVVEIGKISKEAGVLSIDSLDKAIELLKLNYSKQLLTCPISKEAIIMTHSDFMGHTEYLAHAFSIPKVSMLLASDKVRVATVTTHIPVSEIAKNLNQEIIEETIIQCSQYIKDKNDIRPIAVCGLNPHAGEGGKIGNEEIYITMAIKNCRDKNINVEGPYSADTLFTQIHNNSYSAYISMYHDQGLIPFKLMSFGEGVNITLGLPIQRISVDHGTAFNIAGKGKADIRSFKKALDLSK